MTKVSWLTRLRAWGQRHPALAAVLITLLLYLYYLPATAYLTPFYDASSYWTFAKLYYETGHFSLTSYLSEQRGYLFPMLLAPFTQLAERYGWEVLDVTRLLGAMLAAAVFGWAGPALWQAVRNGPPVSLGRRLVFVALGFALWRDYFVFSLTDFPALLALSVALIGVLRGRGLASSLGAGMALAAALNMRPVYQAALPAMALLVLLPLPGRARWWGAARGAALLVGFGLVLWPQLYINDYHTGIRSPWVLTNAPGKPSLFLEQLGWGLAMQKYETSVAADYPQARMIFEDKRGQALFASTGLPQFTEIGQYVRLCLGRPWRAIGVFMRHLFNGLDVQYPTPYIQEVFVPTWPLAWLNYSLIWVGLGVLLVHRWQRPSTGWARVALPVLALLLPCLAALPTAIECRFLLPLHLLLSAAVAFGATPHQWWRTASRRGRIGLAASYIAVVTGGFSASANAQSHLAIRPRRIWNDLPVHFLEPKPAPEPW